MYGLPALTRLHDSVGLNFTPAVNGVDIERSSDKDYKIKMDRILKKGRNKNART